MTCGAESTREKGHFKRISLTDLNVLCYLYVVQLRLLIAKEWTFYISSPFKVFLFYHWDCVVV